MEPFVTPGAKLVGKAVAKGAKKAAGNTNRPTMALAVGGMQLGSGPWGHTWGTWSPPAGSTPITGAPTGAPVTPTGTTNPFGVTEVIGTLGPSACEFIEDPALKELCKSGANLIGNIGQGGTPPPPTTTTPVSQPVPTSTGNGCPQGKIEMFGRCVDPGAALPGGAPFVSAGPGQAVQGAFGMPAMQPMYEQRVHRTCPPGMVLGRDDLCYPRAILRRNSRFRKWRAGRKPKFTAGDMNAIRRARRLKDEAKEIAKDLGYKVTKR